jgi:hypothetical protein
LVSRRKRAREQAPNPVTLRLGDLESEVEARRAEGVAPGAIVKRDLSRYYKLVNLARQHVLWSFKLSQAEALVIAIGPNFDDGAANYIWAEVERRYRYQADAPETGKLAALLPDDFDIGPFIDRLRKLGPFEAMVLLDAIERYWVLHVRQVGDSSQFKAGIDGKLLVEAGLLSEPQLIIDFLKREEEGKATSSGKLEVEDFLRALGARTEKDE